MSEESRKRISHGDFDPEVESASQGCVAPGLPILHHLHLCARGSLRLS